MTVERGGTYDTCSNVAGVLSAQGCHPEPRLCSAISLRTAQTSGCPDGTVQRRIDARDGRPSQMGLVGPTTSCRCYWWSPHWEQQKRRAFLPPPFPAVDGLKHHPLFSFHSVTLASTFEQLGELSDFLVLVGLKLPCKILEPLRLLISSLLLLTILRRRTRCLNRASGIGGSTMSRDDATSLCC